MSKYSTRAYISLIVAISFIIGCTTVDPDSLPREQTFVKFYGTLESDEFVDLKVLDDGYLLLGTTRRNGTNKDYLLIRTDLEGNEIFRRTFEFSHPYIWLINTEPNPNNPPVYVSETRWVAENDEASSMILYSDNDSLAIIGTSTIRFESAQTDDSETTRSVDKQHAFIVKIGLNSIENDNTSMVGIDTIAYRHVHSDGRDYDTEGADIIYDHLDNSPDNFSSFYILGSYAKSDIPDDPKSILLVKTDSTIRTERWHRYYGYQGADQGKQLITKVVDDSGNREFYFLGSITSTGSQGTGGLDVMVVNFSPESGNETVGLVVGERENDVPAMITPFGPDFAIIGTRDTDPEQTFIYVTSDNLTSKNAKVIPERFGGYNGQAILQADDGGLWFTGRVNRYVEDDIIQKRQEGILGKLRSSVEFDEDASQYFGGEGDDIGNTLIRLDDGSILIGATIDFGLNAKMMVLIKTNRLGEIRD